ncbi:MAG: hypothetical protein IJC74_03005 [Clostridia bacterium]|nr:hypothetical protein [Clostridia bacterium]
METEKLERAKLYMEKLANGINPIDNTVIPDNDTVNNVRLSRCFFYIADVLGKVVEDSKRTEKKKVKKVPFDISFEVVQQFPFSGSPLPVSKIAENINSLIDTEFMKKITYKNITDWLISIGMLSVITNGAGKSTKIPTEAGIEIGISTEDRIGKNGPYTAVVYNLDAQHFIVDNIDAVINHMIKKDA